MTDQKDPEPTAPNPPTPIPGETPPASPIPGEDEKPAKK